MFESDPKLEEKIAKAAKSLEEYVNSLEKGDGEVAMPANEAVKEHKRLVNVLEKPSKKKLKTEAGKQKKELKEYKKEIKKSDQQESEMNQLIETVRKAGKDRLKKALPTLSDSQKKLLIGAMSKAISLDKPAKMNSDFQTPDNKSPQKAKEPLTETRKNSEEGVDEWDEKLVPKKAEAAKVRHQGGSGDDGAWTGQIVKSDVEKAVETIKKSFGDDVVEQIGAEAMKKLVKAYIMFDKTNDPKTIEKTEKIEEEQDITADVKKAESEIKDLEKTGCSLEKMVCRMRERGLDRDQSIEKLNKMGYDKGCLYKTWDNSSDAEKQAKVVNKEKKAPEAKGQKEKPMAKSIDPKGWGRNLIASSTVNGQNAHYSVSETILKSEEAVSKAKENKGWYTDESYGMQPLQKSEGAADSNINEMIEKGLDRSLDQITLEKEIKQYQALVKSCNTKSFTEEQLRNVMGLPAEDAEKKKLK